MLVSERESADYFEAVAKGATEKSRRTGSSTSCSTLEQEGKSIEKSPVSAAQLGGLVDLISKKRHLRQDRKGPLRDSLDEGGDPAEIVEKRGMKQVTDTGAIEKAVDEIIAANPDKVEQAKAKPSMLGWFVGQS